MDDTIVQRKIFEDFEEKRVRGERWENEYGCLHRETLKKEHYYDSSQYKVNLHKRNNIMYFKIVPRYYRIPYGYKYWYYYDGVVHDNCLEWKRIRTSFAE